MPRWRIMARIEHINSGHACVRSIPLSAKNETHAMYLLREMFRDSAERLIKVESIKPVVTRERRSTVCLS